MFFVLIVFPGLCLFSLIIGMIHFYREMRQMAIDSREEVGEAKKGIISVSVCCAAVQLCFTVFYFVAKSATEPIEHPDDGSEFILNFFLGGVLTLMSMVAMFGLGCFIGCLMSIDSFFGTFWIRSIIRFIMCILLAILGMFLACVLLG